MPADRSTERATAAVTVSVRLTVTDTSADTALDDAFRIVRSALPDAEVVGAAIDRIDLADETIIAPRPPLLGENDDASIGVMFVLAKADGPLSADRIADALHPRYTKDQVGHALDYYERKGDAGQRTDGLWTWRRSPAST